jgi:phosphate transport system permease protein
LNFKKIVENIPEMTMKILATASIAIITFIFIFVFMRAWPVLSASGIGFFTKAGFDRQISEAFYSPADDPMLVFGMLGLILSTIISTAIALIIAAVVGVGGAVAICELTPKTVAYILTAFIRLLASIPSVIFGLIGIITVIPWINEAFVTTELQIKYLDYFQITGRSLLASVIVLTFMIVPTVISLSIDAINAVPQNYKEAGFAFGMPHFRVIWKIMLPCARSGIIASLILAAGRGIGEAIAVSMVCGGVGIVPDFTKGFAALLAPILPLSAAIINKSEAMGAPAVDSALFSCAAILLIMGAFLSISAKIVERQMRKAVGYDN